jgi:tRNA pseudouridine65 synthase
MSIINSALESLPVHILYQDDNIVAVYKPHGFHTVPHEELRHRVSRNHVLLYQARDLVGKYLYPVHRLDAGTSGIVIFALSSPSAREMQTHLQSHLVEKVYEVVVRGIVPESGQIDNPLELDSTQELVPSLTEFKRLATTEFNVAVGKRNPTAKYSLVEARPRTGRFHQIRRHFNRKSHPVLGDAAHGDSKHNQFFRNELKIPGLCLRARKVQLRPPWLNSELIIEAPTCEKWKKIHSLFDFSNPI